MSKQRVLSGVQPTGSLHLGNYLGAIRSWVSDQSEYENYFFIADLHATTVPHDPKALAQNTYTLAALYLACGLDPAQTTIFVQSHIPAHAELAWLLDCITPLNWLERMIQFKEKALKQAENVSIGLQNYPVLQAADILLYQPKFVPVGEDQKQHLELTRDIAARLNFQFGTPEAPILNIPEPLIRAEGARVMSLTDGTKKMSKSDPSEQSRINLLDTADEIRQKIKRCKTDPARGLTFDDPSRPECQNLLTLYMLMSGQSKAAVAVECAEMGWGQFKPLLAETIAAALAPIQARYYELTQDHRHLEAVLRQGRQQAEQVANQTLSAVKDAMGYTKPL